MGRVMFLLDEVEQLANACVRTQRRDPAIREAPALRVLHDEFHQIYLTSNNTHLGEHSCLRPVTYSLLGWQETPVLAGEVTGRRYRRLHPGRLGDLPLHGLLPLIRHGVDAGWSTFVVDHVDGTLVPGVGRGRFRAPY